MAEERRKTWLVRWVTGACLLTLVGLFAYAQVRGWTPSKVEQAINQNLPRGAARHQIEAYLDAKGWTHNYSDDPITVGYYSEAARPGNERPNGMVFGRVPDPNVGIGGLDEGHITVLFFLGPDGRLLRSYVLVQIISI